MRPLTHTGDVNYIEVGSNTNIQDNAVVHVAKHSISGVPRPTVIGNNVTIGEAAVSVLLWAPIRQFKGSTLELLAQ